MKKDESYDETEKLYMETDDTLDIGKEPLPRTEADKRIFEEAKKELNLK